jgi:hypothetical protein
MIVIETNMQYNFQVVENNRLSMYVSRLNQIPGNQLFLGEKIYQWLAAPDPSGNYQAAREKHEPTTGSWFITGTQFAEWKAKADVLLWTSGACELS